MTVRGGHFGTAVKAREFRLNALLQTEFERLDLIRTSSPAPSRLWRRVSTGYDGGEWRGQSRLFTESSVDGEIGNVEVLDILPTCSGGWWDAGEVALSGLDRWRAILAVNAVRAAAASDRRRGGGRGGIVR